MKLRDRIRAGYWVDWVIPPAIVGLVVFILTHR